MTAWARPSASASPTGWATEMAGWWWTFVVFAQTDRGEKVIATVLGLLLITFMAWRML